MRAVPLLWNMGAGLLQPAATPGNGCQGPAGDALWCKNEELAASDAPPPLPMWKRSQDRFWDLNGLELCACTPPPTSWHTAHPSRPNKQIMA